PGPRHRVPRPGTRPAPPRKRSAARRAGPPTARPAAGPQPTAVGDLPDLRAARRPGGDLQQDPPSGHRRRVRQRHPRRAARPAACGPHRTRAPRPPTAGAPAPAILAALLVLSPAARTLPDPPPRRTERQPAAVELLARSAVSLTRHPLRAARLSVDLLRSGPRLVAGARGP